MSRTTGIEWTQHTVNWFVGCSRISDGCRDCYAIPQALRVESFGAAHYAGVTRRDAAGRLHWTGKIGEAPAGPASKATLPLRTREPTLFFVNSMSDFWFDPETEPAARQLPPEELQTTAQVDGMRRRALDMMARAPQHGYQALTKRPGNILPAMRRLGLRELPPYFWAGATVEGPKVLHRIEELRQVPAALRFLSIEPLIGDVGDLDLRGIHWVIVGGESQVPGGKARPMQAAWVRRVLEACQRQGVPMFLKQWGTPENNPLYAEARARGYNHSDCVHHVEKHDPVGKGGSKLDGREWKQMPAAWSHALPPAQPGLPL